MIQWQTWRSIYSEWTQIPRKLLVSSNRLIN
ncbi:minor tail protein [Bacillus phage BSTP3]|nr:minor tail protein [Bacillus phage BSTP3]